MSAPRLMALTPAASADELRATGALLRAAAPATVVVQLRAPGCSGRELLERAERLMVLARETAQAVIVNDRIDVALAAGADGVHLPGAGVPPLEARRLLGDGKWLSRALHSPDELSSDELWALDAVVISPVMSPRKGREAIGVDTFGAWVQSCRQRSPALGAYALGGVTGDNAQACLHAGASGVAALGAAADERLARELVAALGIARS